MSHRNNARFFVVEYDSITQNIMAIPLQKLLSDVFYGRQCHGKYFKIKSFEDDHTYITVMMTVHMKMVIMTHKTMKLIHQKLIQILPRFSKTTYQNYSKMRHKKNYCKYSEPI